MFKYVQNGDMFRSDCEAWVNTTNTTGVMGAGIAKKMMSKFPEICKTYNEMCQKGRFSGGDVFCQENQGKKGPKYIIQFATKQEVWNPSQMAYIEKGLKQLAKIIEVKEIASIAIPALGCGFGGLEWGEVKDLITQELSHLGNKCDIYVFEKL